MSNLQIYPYVHTGEGWSIADSVMAGIWFQLEQEGKVEHLFYDGAVKDVTDWLAHIKQPRVFPIVVADVEKHIPVHVCWLTDVADGIAWAHHAALGKYHRGVWETVIDYWSKFELRLLLGMTPETNERAVKFLRKICKFQVVGVIPGLCNMAYENRRVGGVISYYQFAKENQKWAEKAAA